MIEWSKEIRASQRERTRSLNDRPDNPHGRYILYWMRFALRVEDNQALNLAIELSNQLKLPVLVYFELSQDHAFANDRRHTFILEGVADVQQELAVRFQDKVQFAAHVRRNGQPESHLATLGAEAAVVVAEEMPVQPYQRELESLAVGVNVHVVAVDTSCIVPMQIVGRAYERAFQFREATKNAFEARCASVPEKPPVPRCAGSSIPLPFLPINLTLESIASIVAECDIDHSVGPIVGTRGGTREGHRRWKLFSQHKLVNYARDRNDALIDGVSQMSPFLHHGMVSSRRLAQDCIELNHAGADKYLDELFVWRELAYAFCFHRSDHDRITAIPEWARATLADHEKDERPKLLSWEAMARGCTGELLWDAAQKSLLMHGVLHNNLRMTWGKAVLSWTQDASSALERITDLNHRYALDGEDPASFGGILWCFGQFDRPFNPEQPIIGKVRSRPVQQHATRLDPKAYAQKTMQPPRESMPSVAIVGAGIAGLVCGRTLADHGFKVQVFEKGRGCGGRMATRRCEMPLGSGDVVRFDHGAQYFECHDRRFRRYVDSWIEDGVVDQWRGHFVEIEGKSTLSIHDATRFVAVPDMSALARHLAADVDVQVGVHVGPLVDSGGRWSLSDVNEHPLGTYDVVVCSGAATRCRELMQDLPELTVGLRDHELKTCWALMAAFDRSLNVDFDGADVAGDALRWIGKNSSKPGRSAHPETWVAHSSHAWSEARKELATDAIKDELLQEFIDVLGCVPSVSPLMTSIHRWRFATRGLSAPRQCHYDASNKVGYCGDWMVDGSVQGGFLSGMAMAGSVMGRWVEEARAVPLST